MTIVETIVQYLDASVGVLLVSEGIIPPDHTDETQRQSIIMNTHV